MVQPLIFDYSKLRGRIVEKFGSCTAFADKIQWHKSYVSAKLSGNTKFTQEDVVLFCELLEIEPSDIGIYFFTLKVQ